MRALDHHEAGRSSLAYRADALDFGPQDIGARGRLFRGDWGEEFGAKDRKQLADLFKELFHVMAVSFREPGAAGRAVVEGEATCGLGLLDQPALKKPDVGLRE